MMTQDELSYLADPEFQENARKYLKRALVYKPDPCKLLGISESNRYYATKVIQGYCGITYELYFRIIKFLNEKEKEHEQHLQTR